MKLWLIFYGAILLAASQAIMQSDADFSFAAGAGQLLSGGG